MRRRRRKWTEKKYRKSVKTVKKLEEEKYNNH